MSLASLEAFLEQASVDGRLQELLISAPDAASVAAIAQSAGYPVSELDLWQASAASPEEIRAGSTAVQPHPEPLGSVVEPSSAGWDYPPPQGATPPPGPAMGGVLPDPWLDDEAPLHRFLHQAQGDVALQQQLATAPDAAAVAAIARAAGYPISELDLWRASAATPEELLDPLAPAVEAALEPLAASEGPSPRQEAPAVAPEDALLGFLHQAQGDEELQRALASADDAEAVAAIARAAGYPISALDLWRACGGGPVEEALPLEPDLSPLDAPLARFLLEAEHDPALREALIDAADAEAVAAIARAAGYPITSDDLWEASDALPEELLISELVIVAVDDDWPN
ncbi:MAG: Nif11-like leader peptide family natural product precursor [Cyanobium sp.]